jgi:hypothetical protein
VDRWSLTALCLLGARSPPRRDPTIDPLVTREHVPAL